MTWLPLLLLPMGLLVGGMTSRFGWQAFAREFGATTRPPGRSFCCPNAWFGTPIFACGRAVSVTFAETGVHVSITPLFRAFHPPFLLPWSTLEEVRPNGSFFGHLNTVRFRHGRARMGLTLGGDALRELKRFRSETAGK